MLLNVVHKFCFANAVFLSLYIFTVIGVVFFEMLAELFATISDANIQFFL